MKKFKVLTLIIVIVILAAVYRNNTSLKLIISDLVYRNGIKNGDLVYEVNLFNLLPIGKAVIYKEKKEKYLDKEVYYLTAQASVSKLVSHFFNANIVLESFVDAKTSNPLTFKQRIRISDKPDINKVINYDQLKGVMTINGTNRMILPNTQDSLSAVFNLKNMDLDKIKEFEMGLNTNQKNYILSGKVTPRQIVINKDKYTIFIIEAQVSRHDKNPYHKSRITMALLRSEVNIPILIKVFSSGLLININLTEIK